MPKKPHLTAAQLDTLRKLLEQKREDLLQKHRAHTSSAVVVDEPLIETGDMAEKEAEIEELIPLAEQELLLLREVEHALDKMDDGTYGISELSGEPIPHERLLAAPWARYNVHEVEGR